MKKQRMTTTLPSGAAALVDSMVGTIYGGTRADVLRFMITSWFTVDNLRAIEHWQEKRKVFDQQRLGPPGQTVG
jgi:hypothetical protein